MALTDVLTQVDQLNRDDLVGLQVAISQLLRARDHVPTEEEAAVVGERYRDYLADPEASISVDELMAHLGSLITA